MEGRPQEGAQGKGWNAGVTGRTSIEGTITYSIRRDTVQKRQRDAPSMRGKHLGLGSSMQRFDLQLVNDTCQPVKAETINLLLNR